MQPQWPLKLFKGFGLELEYMLVHKGSLAVYPISDQVLTTLAGKLVAEIQEGVTAWSNELVLHVLELKNAQPHDNLSLLRSLFQEQVRKVNSILKTHDGCLLPTSAHPWMNPDIETQIWPHQKQTIYETYNRIFDCKGHGWSNLQSIQITLPFGNTEEFGRLHAAIRVLLPLLPALFASSPILDGKLSDFLDARLETYRWNAIKIPSITGRIIPEPVFTPKDYEKLVLQKMYKDIAPYDPDKTLQEEWLNSRGAIPKFEVGGLEIRILDIQECVPADLALAACVIAILKALVEEKWSSWESQKSWEVEPLAQLIEQTIQTAETTPITSAEYLKLFGFNRSSSCTTKQLFEFLTQALQTEISALLPDWEAPLDVIFRQGPLSRRIVTALNGDLSLENLRSLYQQLADCLEEGKLFQV